MKEQSLKKRCDIRLTNDARELKKLESERMRVEVSWFGKRVTDIIITFPAVKTAFMNINTRNVEVHKSLILAVVIPNAGSTFPYPMGPPDIRIFIPELQHVFVPWLSGLLWLDKRHLSNRHELSGQQAVIRDLVGKILESDGPPSGNPCLWRKGGWNLERDFVFVARQVHTMLTDPGGYSPTDAMNPEAALYWAGHKNQLPLEVPIPAIYGYKRSQALTSSTDGFSLTEVT